MLEVLRALGSSLPRARTSISDNERADKACMAEQKHRLQVPVNQTTVRCRSLGDQPEHAQILAFEAAGICQHARPHLPTRPACTPLRQAGARRALCTAMLRAGTDLQLTGRERSEQGLSQHTQPSQTPETDPLGRWTPQAWPDPACMMPDQLQRTFKVSHCRSGSTSSRAERGRGMPSLRIRA